MGSFAIPSVEKYVNKVTILKTIEEKKKCSHARLGNPSLSPRVPCLLQSLPASNAPASVAHIPSTLESFADHPLEKDGGGDVPPLV